jgi:hypothetical protein
MEEWTDRLIQGIKGNEPALHSILYPSLSVSRALSLQRKVEKETVVGPWTREGTLSSARSLIGFFLIDSGRC